MKGFLKSRLVLTLVTMIMLASAIAIPLADSFLHSRPTHAQAPMWTASGNILLPRYSFPATTLPNGKALIEGGFAPGSYTTDSELFDPATGVWTNTGSLNQGRGEHSATLLQDGRVLVAGGYAGPVLNSAEIYDPSTSTWIVTGSMSQVRTRHTATLLPNGKVLVAGGWNGDVISGAELYDPTSGSWSSAGNMLIPRAGQVAVLLPNGKVLIAGGGTSNNQPTTESELYDPNANTWTQTGSLNVLTGGTGILLPNGKVLMAGGGTSTAELYDPATGTWTLTGSMQRARNAGLGMQALLLTDGTVLMAGGDTAGTSEVYDPSSGTWGTLTSMVAPQCGGATALLSDGRPLIAGGTDCASTLTTVTELYSSSPPPRKVLFIDLQGIQSSLSATQASDRNGDGYSPAFFDTVNNIPGISPYLMANGYQQARYVAYSYTGFTASGGPMAYTCLNTFTNPLLVDARLLAKQIATLADSNTDVYLIGHSLGGVIASTYLAGYVEHLGNLAPLPKGAAIKGVITLDSPIGGISDNKDYNDFLTSFYTTQCSGLTASTMVSVHNLRQIFKTATDNNHLGATVSIVKVIYKGKAITNQAVADAAKSQGIALLTIKNVNDLLWRPSVCNTQLGTKMTDFPSTQALTDEGSLVYGRQFTSGAVDCQTLLSGGNHGIVLHFTDVDTALTQFLPNGGVPSALAVAP